MTEPEDDDHPRRTGDALLQRRQRADAAVRARRRRDPDAASRAARSGPTAFQPNRLLEVTPEFLERVVRYLRRRGLDIVSLDEVLPAPGRAGFLAPLRLHHHRRRLSRHAAMGLSDPQALRRAVRRLYPDELPGPAGRVVVARARGRGGAQQPRHAAARRRRAGLRLRDGDGEARPLRPALSLCAQPSDRGSSCACSCAISAARYHVDIAEFCNDLCMNWNELDDARRRSAGDDRRAHRQSRDAREGAGAHGALRDGDEPLGDRGLARQAAGSSVLSGRRQDLGRARASSRSPRSSASRPRSRRGRACCSRSTAII